MKFTFSWLKEYLQTELNLDQICQKLTDIGLEVESVEKQSDNLKIFTVAQIVDAKPHPDSDKLQICQVDVGEKENLQIICGAKNARTNLKVIYAPIGSVIPANEMKIKKSKIRGVESCGMLCSAFELGLGKDGEGIIEIDQNVKIGTAVTEIYGSKDPVIEINITPNRGDCLGVYGIARDLAGSGAGVLKKPQIQQINGSFSSKISVDIEKPASQSCPYFAGYYIKNINNKASPNWLKERLESIGVNSINAVVDITNYVMYSLNQPLHAYDADKIEGNIKVKMAKNGEIFTSLKNLQYSLNENDLLICDDNKIDGLAGIIGSNSTTTLEESKNIFLEGAFFNSDGIASSGRRLNILSDARYRFERNIDIRNVKNALNMAANLILEICGGEISNIQECGSDNFLAKNIDFDFRQISKITNVDIDQEAAIQILVNLGFEAKKIDDNNFKITPPSFRSDITIFQDLVEEIVRIYGYDKIKSKPIENIKIATADNSENINSLRLRLCTSGIDEVINWSFINSKIVNHFAPINNSLFIANAISEEMDYMRPSLIPSLIGNIQKNQDRGFNNLSLFEIGKIFTGLNIEDQKESLAVVRCGKNKEKNHYKDDRFFDVMDIKKDLFLTMEALDISVKSLQIIDCDNKEFFDLIPKYYHQYRSAVVKIGRNVVGYFGEIHPLINKKFDVKNRINAFEILLDQIPSITKKYKSKAFVKSDFPVVNRDFAFIFDNKVKVGEITRLVKSIDQELINEVNIFDIYQGNNIEENKKSVAFNIEIAPKARTLTSEEIDDISKKVIDAVSLKLNGVLRS